MTVRITLPSVDRRVSCRSLDGEERLGEGFELEALIDSLEPIAADAVLGSAAHIDLETEHGTRRVAGVVARFTAVATTRTDARRRYRLLVRPGLCFLELKRRSRVFRKTTAAAIVKQLLEEGGYAPKTIAQNAKGGGREREFTVQYDETDATFVRRLCEEDGIYLRFHGDDGSEGVAIEDDSRKARPAPQGTVKVVSDTRLLATEPCVHQKRIVRRRRAATVRLDDYDPLHPSVELKVRARADEASDNEREAALYVAPGGYREKGMADVNARYRSAGKAAGPDALAGSGEARALLALEAARADAFQIELESNVMSLAPGSSVKLEHDVETPDLAKGDHVIVAVTHRYRFDDDRHLLALRAIPKSVPFRIARVTPRPRIAGVQSAMSTGDKGEEVHTDAIGRAFVRFHWDVAAPNDATSSLAIRTLQPNMPDSMLLPRVGWEVLVTFEDGDPERPYVVGRSYNGRMMPPFALPANKTVTSFATDSSPGGAGRHAITFDDRAGHELVHIQAPLHRTVKVGEKAVTQTGNNERQKVKGDAKHLLRREQVLAITESLLSTLGSLEMKVGEDQKTTTKGDHASEVGGETVVVGAALVEQVGNPVKGFVNLGMNGAIQAVGGKFGQTAASALGVAKATVEGYLEGGAEGALKAAGKATAGAVASFVPGGEAGMAMFTGSTQPNPWDHGKPVSGSAAPTMGSIDALRAKSEPGKPGPGHRIIDCSGFGLEVMHNFVVATPGQIGWTTSGLSGLVTYGPKHVKAATGTHRTLGASIDKLGSRKVESRGKLGRKSTRSATITAKGALNVNAKEYYFHSKMAHLDIGASLTLVGNITFEVGNSTVTINDGILKMKTCGVIEVSGMVKNAGDTSHPSKKK
jgi:type VI secretion system secreted protein VgrG